ncbi:hypothetical protein OFO94_26655, partial [Escherichia coli]|nr:hypothetical protein [Escherichia coli]
PLRYRVVGSPERLGTFYACGSPLLGFIGKSLASVVEWGYSEKWPAASSMRTSFLISSMSFWYRDWKGRTLWFVSVIVKVPKVRKMACKEDFWFQTSS